MEEIKRIQTRYFGEVEYDKTDCVHFPAGLFAFEDEHEFLLLPFSGGLGSLLCMQSTKTPSLSFTVLDPFVVHGDYDPKPQSGEIEALGAKERGELCYYVLCAMREPITECTVNLKCPVVIHPDTRVAAQLILDSQEYNMRHSLVDFIKKGAGEEC